MGTHRDRSNYLPPEIIPSVPPGRDLPNLVHALFMGGSGMLPRRRLDGGDRCPKLSNGGDSIPVMVPRFPYGSKRTRGIILNLLECLSFHIVEDVVNPLLLLLLVLVVVMKTTRRLGRPLDFINIFTPNQSRCDSRFGEGKECGQ